MIMKKTIQAFLLLSLVHILLCASFQVGVTEARFRHLAPCQTRTGEEYRLVQPASPRLP
ncbi:hypothetical protein Bca52824_007812 [Brassica carinata]|uniref:Uncharacterized protein n=1 Tax=Brassica carinata TaxID=52824 RepID=A0A8X7W8N7_BRACI|nr:hypothetical protein Bca52824_007812 [Brassica carinata]